MEHFFLEDCFYGDLDDFINDLFPENGDIDALPDDWSIRVQESKLEPMFQLTEDHVKDVLTNYLDDQFDDRFPLDDNDRCFDEIALAIDECFDVNKFNSLVPKLYYPDGYETITKQDLLDYLND